jgi:hypothetical protein
MAGLTPTKIVLVVALAAAALQDVGDRVTVGALLFGVFNALFARAGTAWIRGLAIGASFLMMLLPGDARLGMVFLAWLLWPPAFLVAWALGREQHTTVENEGMPVSAVGANARMTTAAIIVAVAIGSLAYRAIAAHNLEQTAALFVGVPAILAIVVVFAVSPRSATGVACKAVTVGLLVSLLFLWEGVLCVVMSAPLFYVVAVVIGAAADRARGGFGTTHSTVSCLALLAIVPLSLEGVTGSTTLDRDEWVTAIRIVRASPEEVGGAVIEPPRFDRALPLFLRAGFPRPESTRVDRDGRNVQLVIRLRGGEMRIDGMEPRTGDLILQLEESHPRAIRWRAVADGSHMTHFLMWREATIRWEPMEPGATKVTCTLRYKRGLDPAWYFGPLERYAATLAAGYLIDAVATP